jgi:hypothetical protein
MYLLKKILIFSFSVAEIHETCCSLSFVNMMLVSGLLKF